MQALGKRAANRSVFVATILATTALAGTVAAQDRSGAVVQSIPPAVSQNPTVPQLHLSDAQRSRIQQALSRQDTEVSFGLKSAKPSQNFAPSVGAAVPKGLKPHTLPRPLIYQMPLLKAYTYLKFKHEVLIIDPMSRKIVDLFPEASG
ncbi:MAG TPA: hypothetical protein VGH49_09475 [Xanthobacteraceae bacterium]